MTDAATAARIEAAFAAYDELLFDVVKEIEDGGARPGEFLAVLVEDPARNCPAFPCGEDGLEAMDLGERHGGALLFLFELTDRPATWLIAEEPTVAKAMDSVLPSYLLVALYDAAGAVHTQCYGVAPEQWS